MDDADLLHFRPARLTDAAAIAALHADSWRRHYRGAYSDAFLDGDVAADRMAVWQVRLSTATDGEHTLLAEHRGVVVGFIHTILGEDPIWGRCSITFTSPPATSVAALALGCSS